MNLICRIAIIIVLMTSLSQADDHEKADVPVRLVLLRKLPHDQNDYCQGLSWFVDPESGKELFCESTGRYGSSKLKLYDPESGNVLQSVALANRFFGEGSVHVADRIYVLTWQERTCLVFDRMTLKIVDEFRYPGEGWGLTFDGHHLIMSDGTATLRFLDPKTFAETRRLNVFHSRGGRKYPLKKLNELEWIDGEVWANIYGLPWLVRINVTSGEVVQVINCESLVPEKFKGNDDFVLNGIAWNKKDRRLYLTGKCWPVTYEFKLERKEQ